MVRSQAGELLEHEGPVQQLGVRVGDLQLDLDVPLSRTATSQRGALERIIALEHPSLIDLMTEFASNGIESAHRTLRSQLVTSLGGAAGAERNRRIAALRILTTPTIIDGLKIRPYVSKRLREVAASMSRLTLAPATPVGGQTGILNRKESSPAYFTPLRYPGGKGKLAPFVKLLLEANDMLDGEYVEPYAGGAAIGIELLINGYVSRVHINDISRPIFAFWKASIDHTDDMLRLIRDTPLTLDSWDRHKHILRHEAEHNDLELGFAAFFLNRTNRSGIFNAGVIGGRRQTGTWKIDARFPRDVLAQRIRTIADFKSRIELTRHDALTFLKERLPRFTARTLIYLDPPYYEKGKALYFDYYEKSDHKEVAEFVTKRMRRKKWLVSYDNAREIRELYRASRGIAYGLGYSARDVKQGSEVMFFADTLTVPAITGGMRPLVGGARPFTPVGVTSRMPTLRRKTERSV